MNQPPTTAGTWAPDWRTLKQARDKAIVNIRYANDDQFNEAAYGAIVHEYQRQAAAAGWVLVRREDLIEFMAYAANPKRLHTAKSIAAWECILATLNSLAATPGGDAG